MGAIIFSCAPFQFNFKGPIFQMELLAKAEQIDRYRTTCNRSELNRLARSKHIYSVFSNESPEPLQQIADTMDLTRGSKIVILHPSADNGYPHTRPGNLICMPAGFSLYNAPKTLLHEACHLHQRAHESKWVGYSVKEGWWPIDAGQIPERWRARCRINPDTMAIPFWSWQDYYVPLPLYRNEQSPSMGECDVSWYDLRNGVLYKVPPLSFAKRYGDIGQPEHPFEVSAIEFSEKLIKTKEELMNVLTTG
jgi:hypothetical protein